MIPYKKVKVSREREGVPMRRAALLPALIVLVMLGGARAAAPRRVVTLMIDTHSAPYAYRLGDEFRGISVELLRLVFDKMPYDLELIEATDSQILELRERGELGEAGFFPIISENGTYVRSDPLFTLSHGLYTRKDYHRVTVANAPQENIGMRWHPYLRKLARSYLGISAYTPYNTTREGVEKLLDGDIDVLFEEESAINETLDALSGQDLITTAQSGLFATPVSIVLPGSMSDLMDDINVRISQVRSSGIVTRLLLAEEEPEPGLDIAGGNVVLPFAAVGVLSLLFAAAIIATRSLTRARIREFEALGESFPLLALGDDGAITFINKPARELFGDFKLSPGKKFAKDERFENARTGLSMDMPPERGEPDVLLLKNGIIHWRGSLEVARAKPSARFPGVILRFSTLSEQARKRDFAILSAIMETQGSFAAFCEGVFEALETQFLATAMGVYLPEGSAWIKVTPLFETSSFESGLRAVIAKLYKLVYENGLRVLMPDDITELAARCGVRYNEQVRFVAAPLTTENEMTGMLFLRLRLSAREFTAAEREMVRSVAWRMSAALQRFDQDSRSRRFAWYDSRTRLPNAAYFEQLLRRVCGESVKAPAGIQASFIVPAAGSVVMLRVVPRDNDVMNALAPKLAVQTAARLSGEVFGLLIGETDLDILRERLEGLMARLRPELPGGTALFAGAARFPFDALSASGLMDLARRALSEAKQYEIVIYGG